MNRRLGLLLFVGEGWFERVGIVPRSPVEGLVLRERDVDADELDALVVERLQERQVVADAHAAVLGVDRVGGVPADCDERGLPGCDPAIVV